MHILYRHVGAWLPFFSLLGPGRVLFWYPSYNSRRIWIHESFFLFWFSHTKNDSNQPNRFLIDVRFEQVNSINANRTDNWQFRHKTISCILQQTDANIVPDGRSLRTYTQKSPIRCVHRLLKLLSLTTQLKTDYHRKDDGTGSLQQ